MMFNTDVRLLAYEVFVENAKAEIEKNHTDTATFACPICNGEVRCRKEGIKLYADCEGCNTHMIGEL